jgi:hypothetical protein
MSVASVQQAFALARQEVIHPEASVHALRHSMPLICWRLGSIFGNCATRAPVLETTLIYTHLTALSEARTRHSSSIRPSKRKRAVALTGRSAPPALAGV